MPQKKILYAVTLITSLLVIPASASSEKTIVVAVASNFTTLDPYDANDSLSQAVAKSFYQGLYGFDKDLKLKPVLAESYTVSTNGREWIFKLRPKVKFQDGTDFDATAVKINFDRASNPNNHLKRFNLFSDILKTDVLDPLTVKVLLKRPFSSFINTVAHPAAVMISPSALKKYGKSIGFHPVGTGPYRFVSWSQNDYLKVDKWSNYWHKGYPKLDSIIWRPVVDNNTRAAMLETQEATFAFPVPFEQTATLSANSALKVESWPSNMQRYISMNVTQPPFDNPKVRAALNYAVNRMALVKVAFSGFAIPATGIIPSTIAYSVSYPAIGYDPAKARALLKEAGYPNGFTTTLWSSHNHSTAQKVLQFIQQQFATVGITARVTAMDAGQRAAQVESQDQKKSAVQLFYTGWTASTGEANWALSPLFATSAWPPAGFNTAFYSNIDIDHSLLAALATADEHLKSQLYKKVQDIIWQAQPWIPLLTEKLVSARNQKLHHFNVMPDTLFDFEQAELN